MLQLRVTSLVQKGTLSLEPLGVDCAEQENRCGPVSLEQDQFNRFQIAVHTTRATGIPSTADVFCKVAHHPSGGCLVQLNSGIKASILTAAQ